MCGCCGPQCRDEIMFRFNEWDRFPKILQPEMVGAL